MSTALSIFLVLQINPCRQSERRFWSERRDLTRSQGSVANIKHNVLCELSFWLQGHSAPGVGLVSLIEVSCRLVSIILQVPNLEELSLPALCDCEGPSVLMQLQGHASLKMIEVAIHECSWESFSVLVGMPQMRSLCTREPMNYQQVSMNCYKRSSLLWRLTCTSEFAGEKAPSWLWALMYIIWQAWHHSHTSCCRQDTVLAGEAVVRWPIHHSQ